MTSIIKRRTKSFINFKLSFLCCLFPFLGFCHQIQFTVDESIKFKKLKSIELLGNTVNSDTIVNFESNKLSEMTLVYLNYRNNDQLSFDISNLIFVFLDSSIINIKLTQTGNKTFSVAISASGTSEKVKKNYSLREK